ncbi:hypothetical protein BS78_06G033700 [Paspalum vaginatum]|nr:hypothetical protein BS78_06G033700 [Paspalum vaginatum]
MEITVHSSKSVKPDYGDSSNGDAAFASADVVPLSVFDKVNYDEYIFYVYAFHPPSPPTTVLVPALAKTLAEYREWAGRFGVDGSGNPAIVLSDAGARFIEATAATEFAGSVKLLTTGDKVLSLYPICDGAEELLLVQATRFRCGSLVLGFTMHHKVADGPGMWNFMVAWGQVTRGVAIDPVPVHDRTSLFARQRQDSPAQVKFEHRGAEFKPRAGGEIPGVSCGNVAVHADGEEVVVHRVHFTREWITELKSRASSNRGGAWSCTTLQCVAAHLWRSVTEARGLGAREATRIRVAVNGRARMKNPPVPEGYTGSVVLWAWPATTARELLRRPLRYAVELISREVARTDDAYFWSFVDFASSGAVERERLVPTADAAEVPPCTNVDVDCLLAIPFAKLDFGCGPPFFFRPGYSPAPVAGAIYVLKSFEGDGGVDAYVPLFSRTMDAFKKSCYSLTPPMADARL